VVNKLRWAIRKKFDLKKIKVGHAGTLDPLATGLLIICTGKKTKSIEEFQGQEKEYTGTFIIGSTTPSYDLETEIDQRFETNHISLNLLKETTESFIGEIEQIPPIFSAIKQDGKRAYNVARAGEKIELKARKITISEFEIVKFEDLKVHFRVVCSKGTYIRSLAHDFGQKLHSGAHLSGLRRTRIGNFKVDNAQSLEAFLESL